MTAEEPTPDPRPTPTVLAQGEGAVDVVPDAARVVIGVQVASSGLATARDEAGPPGRDGHCRRESGGHPRPGHPDQRLPRPPPARR